MGRAAGLARHIERTVAGPMWHGPVLLDVLKGVTSEQARARPVPGAHTIWEIVLHVTAWCDIARLRLAGEAIGDPAPEQDWPPIDAAHAGPDDWPRAVERMAASHRQLAAAAAALSDDQINALVPGLDYTVAVM